MKTRLESDKDWEWRGLDEMEDAIIRPDCDDGPNVFCPASAAEYIRENFIPRARVLALHKQLEAQWTVHGSYATMSAADLRELFEYLLK